MGILFSVAGTCWLLANVGDVRQPFHLLDTDEETDEVGVL